MGAEADPAEAGSEIRTYRLDPSSFVETTKRRLRKRLTWLAPFLVAIVAVQFALFSRAGLESDTLPVGIAVVFLVLGISLFRGARRELRDGRAGWESYRLTMGPNVLRRFIVNLPAVEIVRPEVVRIVEVEGEGITVSTSDRHRFVFVPSQLVGFEEARARLAGWKAFEPAKPGRGAALGVGWSVLLMGAWFGTGMIPDIRLAMLAALVLFAAAGISIREILALKVTENKHKATLLGGLALLLVAPFARLFLHFVYHADPVWPR